MSEPPTVAAELVHPDSVLHKGGVLSVQHIAFVVEMGQEKGLEEKLEENKGKRPFRVASVFR